MLIGLQDLLLHIEMERTVSLDYCIFLKSCLTRLSLSSRRTSVKPP